MWNYGAPPAVEIIAAAGEITASQEPASQVACCTLSAESVPHHPAGKVNCAERKRGRPGPLVRNDNVGVLCGFTDVVRNGQAGSQCSPLRVVVYITLVRLYLRCARPTAAGLKPRPTGSGTREHGAGRTNGLAMLAPTGWRTAGTDAKNAGV